MNYETKTHLHDLLEWPSQPRPDWLVLPLIENIRSTGVPLQPKWLTSTGRTTDNEQRRSLRHFLDMTNDADPKTKYNTNKNKNKRHNKKITWPSVSWKINILYTFLVTSLFFFTNNHHWRALWLNNDASYIKSEWKKGRYRSAATSMLLMTKCKWKKLSQAPISWSSPDLAMSTVAALVDPG